MLEQINSTGKAIDELGGDAAVARLLRVKDTRVVWNWRERGFPQWTFVLLKSALERKGKTAPDRLWGMGKQPVPARTAS